jgi:hypothetical protein
MFTHIVFFWLNENAPAGEQDALIASCTQLLGKIPTVRQLTAGKPAMTPRDVVDNSYSVALYVRLDDKAGHDVYQEHSLHKQFIERHKPNWKRVQVYDFVS